MSPYCPGRSLPDCPSPQAAQLREWIIAQETAGRARAEVESELLERYGEEILQAPRARGFGLTAYVAPLLAFLAGGVVVALFLRRQGRRVAAGTDVPGSEPPRTPHDRDLEQTLEAEMAGRE
jgi:cytochrome c-type biogenesis protein CcmH/NrfF